LKSTLENAQFAGNRCVLGDLQLGSVVQEMEMRVSWTVLMIALLGLVAADPAYARHAHRTSRHCVGQTADGPTLQGFFFNPAPRANGCAPAVYAYGRYVGQDPDPFIRQQLNRDPQTGYYQY
jgi:hypothetical protein